MADATPSSPDDNPSVHVTGVPTELTDHPALRKIARAVLSIAARELEQQKANQPEPEHGDD